MILTGDSLEEFPFMKDGSTQSRAKSFSSFLESCEVIGQEMVLCKIKT
jgi:hypothetical protein